jgi:single-stranded-DNA-specific exonuclease
MPTGPERFVEHPAYETEFTKARALLLAHPGRWRILYHYDGDGIASASCAVRALGRLGYPAQATPFVGVERSRMAELLKASPGPLLIVDTGASWLDLYPSHAAPVIVLDHHQYPGSPQPPALPDHVAFVNPLDWGVDGMRELCASTLTWLYTIFLDPRNWDNAAWGISGGISDRQHVGGFHGLSKVLVDEAARRSLVAPQKGLRIGFGPVGAALSTSIDPYFKGLSGRPDRALDLLRSLAIDPETAVDALGAEAEHRLREALRTHLVDQKVRPEFVELLVEEAYRIPALDADAQEIANWQNATGRVGTPGIGIALALGDPSARDRARAAALAWQTGVLEGLLRLEEGGLKEMKSVQWFESPEPTLAGTQAGLAMNYLLDQERPVFAFTATDAGPVKVSARGTLWLVGRGLDLSLTCREAAAKVGGEGGGHKVASGATLPAGQRDAFLEEADRLVALQLGGPSA